MKVPIRPVPALLCAALLALPRPAPAASFGNICEASLYAGAAYPLYFAGAVGGAAAVTAGGYILFDAGESFYVGVRETNAALLGDDPRETRGARSRLSGTFNAWLVTQPAPTAEPERLFADLALDPRLQIGGADADVFGLRLGILSAENHDVYGLDVCTLLGRTLGDQYGIQAGLFNLVDGDVGALQAGLANVAGGSMRGIQAAGLFNAAAGDDCSLGVQVAGLANRARDFGGLQVGLVNVCREGAGLQVGLVNRARNLRGVQIGLVNEISDHEIAFLPILNAGF